MINVSTWSNVEPINKDTPHWLQYQSHTCYHATNCHWAHHSTTATGWRPHNMTRWLQHSHVLKQDNNISNWCCESNGGPTTATSSADKQGQPHLTPYPCLVHGVVSVTGLSLSAACAGTEILQLYLHVDAYYMLLHLLQLLYSQLLKLQRRGLGTCPTKILASHHQPNCCWVGDGWLAGPMSLSKSCRTTVLRTMKRHCISICLRLVRSSSWISWTRPHSRSTCDGFLGS